MKRHALFVGFLLCTLPVFCQYTVGGRVLDEKTKQPVEYASVLLVEKELWAVSNEKGEFLIRNISKGKASFSVSCLGYAPKTFELNISSNLSEIVFYLPENNLTLKEVTVTAKSKRDEIATTYVIDRNGLDHLQVMNVSDALSLLPGGQSNRSPHFATGEQLIALRSTSGESGNPTFGTAVEVDGVRLSNNGSYNLSSGGTAVYGVDTRSIASGNIESVEVVTGIPSVEYGDMTSGMVKVNTRKGKAPLNVEVSVKPNTKLYAANKGFDFGQNKGVLNASIEHTQSVSDLASPYTSYDRNGLSLYYSNTLNKQHQPIRLESGITGNIGGYNSKNDPDAFKDTYTKKKDNTLRANLKANWLLQRSWITNLEVSGTVSYADNLSEENTDKSGSVRVAAIHGREEGYFIATKYDENPDAPIVLIPTGNPPYYWYQLAYTDSKPLNINLNLKARWVRRLGNVNSNLLAGTDFTSSGNSGRGTYYDDLRYAPTWREYRFDEIPFMNNLAVYVEEKADLRLSDKSTVQAVAGIRSDQTFVRQSAYGTVGSLSPRFNAKYSYKGSREQWVENFALRAGWGKAVKLPSFAVLYPAPSYSDKLAFASATTEEDATSYSAYYIRPFTSKYNPNLKWQYNRQMEIGLEAKIKGINLSIALFNNKMMNGYSSANEYSLFSYSFTPVPDATFPIPSADRQYSIDQTTGIVTVHDKTGQLPDQILENSKRNLFKTDNTYINSSPATRKGIEWIVDFGKIKPIQTSIRMDGNYYHYRATEENILQYAPPAADNSSLKFIGFYAGGNGARNGFENKQLNTNVTFITHIPAIRLIVSLKVESTLYNSTQNLSEYSGGQRSFAVSADGDYFPATDQPNRIYNSDRRVATYPLYYASIDDPDTKIPFEEKFLWAKDNDKNLYNALAGLVMKSNTDYYFNGNKISGYYSANISVTKEIGDHVSLSFNATNFTNNIGLVKLSANNTEQTLFRSSYIPQFYYGLSLKIKL